MKGKNTFKVNWTRSSEEDILTIIDYFLDQYEISIAESIYDAIKKSVLQLETFPFSGRIVPELEYFNILSYREVLYKNWRVIYRVSKKEIYVMAVVDGRRNIEDILLKRLVRG